MALTSDQITAKNFQKFYNLILPYLNGAPGCTPIGTIIAVMGNSAPAYYLKCDGTIYNIADYPDLANYFDVQFDGEINKFGGDGITTFAVPDLRGEFLRGTGTNSHENQGNGGDVGEHQDGSIHSNVYMIENGTNGWAPQRNQSNANNPDKVVGGILQGISGTKTTATNLTATYTSRPTNTSVLYCIAYKNIYAESSGGGGSDVTVTPIITSGEKIAVIGVDGVDNDLYAPLPKEYDSGDGIDITNDTISVDEMSSTDMSEIISPSPSIMCRRMIYTESDQIVGTWIDGSTVYQKTFTGKTSTTSGKSVKLGELSNMSQVVSKNGFYHHLGGYWVGLDEYQSSTAIVALFIYDNGEVYIFAQGDNNRLNRDVVVTIQYTKTV